MKIPKLNILVLRLFHPFNIVYGSVLFQYVKLKNILLKVKNGIKFLENTIIKQLLKIKIINYQC